MNLLNKKTDEINKILLEYDLDQDTSRIAILFNKNRSTILKIVKSNGRKVRERGSWKKKYDYNTSFFNKIDTEEKAYWLGFISADGHISNTPGRRLLSITLSDVDKEHLIKLQKSLKLINHKLTKIDGSYGNKNGSRTQTNKTLSMFCISCKEIALSLEKLGLRNNKTFNLDYEQIISQIPSNLLNHFIRGFFDGDGTWSGKNRNSLVFSITSASVSLFLIPLYEHLITTLNLKRTKIQSKKGTVAQAIYFTGINALKIFNYMYSNATISLDRKYIKSRNLISNHRKYCKFMKMNNIDIDQYPMKIIQNQIIDESSLLSETL